VQAVDHDDAVSIVDVRAQLVGDFARAELAWIDGDQLHDAFVHVRLQRDAQALSSDLEIGRALVETEDDRPLPANGGLGYELSGDRRLARARRSHQYRAGSPVDPPAEQGIEG